MIDNIKGKQILITSTDVMMIQFWYHMCYICWIMEQMWMLPAQKLRDIKMRDIKKKLKKCFRNQFLFMRYGLRELHLV